MKAILNMLTLFGVVFCTLSLRAQETAAQRHAMATNHLQNVAAAISAECLTGLAGLEDWKGRRDELHRQLLYMLGLDPMPKRVALSAHVTGRLERDGYHIEKLVYQSLPGLYVTGNFYVPKDITKPAATILYLCGHAGHPQGAKVGLQDDGAVWFALHGYPCLVLDTLEFGEVPGIHHGTHNLNMWNWLSLGYTPAGVEVWNAMRGVDYLISRPEVDAKRIGLTGISGGGAMTWYTAAVDDRIAVAAPVCSSFTFGSQAAHWLASGQCDCIYYPNAFLWDFPIVGALIAPRPLLILSGRKDTIFPPDGYHEVFKRAKIVYDFYAGATSERIREMDDNVPHSNPPQFHREARQWMQRWLTSETNSLPVEEPGRQKESAADLACLTNLPPDAINYRIQNQFTSPVALPTMTSRSGWQSRRTVLLGQLKDKVLRWFPTNEIGFATRQLPDGAGWGGLYADHADYSFQSELGARIRAQVFTPRGKAGKTPLVIYVKRPGDSLYNSDFDELSPLLGRVNVMVLYPRFTEQTMTPAEHTDVERTAAWVGRTIASMQLWDILRAVEWAEREKKFAPSSIAVYGKGDMGILGLYAGVLDARVDEVILNDAPGSHWEGPALLNVLRITDIAELAGAFAPRRLVSLTEFPKTFGHTKSIYQIYGQPSRMARSGSLPEAVEIWKYPGDNGKIKSN